MTRARRSSFLLMQEDEMSQLALCESNPRPAQCQLYTMDLAQVLPAPSERVHWHPAINNRLCNQSQRVLSLQEQASWRGTNGAERERERFIQLNLISLEPRTHLSLTRVQLPKEIGTLTQLVGLYVSRGYDNK